jgi:hypothetical protein
MLVQIAIGSALIFLTMTVSTGLWFLHERVLIRLRRWTGRRHFGFQMVTVLLNTLFSTILMMTASVWIWAVALRGLGLFDSLEHSVYFSLVAFTTLGFGDVLLPAEWQLLGGLSAANGLLLFGLLTAMLVETLRETRLSHQGSRGS